MLWTVIGQTPAGRFSEYLAFHSFLSDHGRRPLNGTQDFLPKLVNPSREWRLDWRRASLGSCGPRKKVHGGFANRLHKPSEPRGHSAAQRWVLPIWLFAMA